jgi:hypothetical protein
MADPTRTVQDALAAAPNPETAHKIAKAVRKLGHQVSAGRTQPIRSERMERGAGRTTNPATEPPPSNSVVDEIYDPNEVNWINDEFSFTTTHDEASDTTTFAFDVALSSDPGTPSTYEEAITDENAEQWKQSMLDEIMNFVNREAWLKIPREEVRRKGRRPIPQKWVYKLKDEQDLTKRFKSRTVTKGFLQIPGVDFTESFSPVATDTTIRLAIGLTLYYQEERGWVCELVDIEAAFLNADQETELFVEWPKGIVELGVITEDDRIKFCIQLGKSQYGNVDAALRWTKTFAKDLIEKLGFTQSKVDPCLFYRRDANGNIHILIVVYVDDVMIIGAKHDVEWFKTELRKINNIKDLGRLKKHLGIWYEWLRDEKGPYVRANMDDMAKGIITDYSKYTGKSAKGAKTPGYPNVCLTKGAEDDEVLNLEHYRSLVGKIMYYVTKISPETSNAARELSQFMSTPTRDHWKAMDRMVGYLQDKPSHHLIYRKPRELRPIGSADSNYATSADDRRSITGNIHTLGGMITGWTSKKQPIVTLSSTEAEYVSVSMHCQETLFLQMLLDEVAESVRPAVIYEDNMGCIYLTRNQQVGARTKHIDVRHHFIRENVENGNVKVCFVPTEDNEADCCTKNLPEKIFAKHASDLLNGTLRYWIGEDVGNDIRDSRLTSDPNDGQTTKPVPIVPLSAPINPGRKDAIASPATTENSEDSWTQVSRVSRKDRRRA